MSDLLRMIDALNRRITFVNPPVPMKFRFSTNELTLPQVVQLKMRIEVPDRDHGQNVTVDRTDYFDPIWFMRNVHHDKTFGAVQVLENAYAMMRHEVEESLHLDGVRIFDPHKREL